MSQPRKVEIDVHVEAGVGHVAMAREIAAGLSRTPKTLPSKYFYDERGSELFERITELPEYYQTRTELELLEARAGEITGVAAPRELLELGSGSAKKTRVLIEAGLAHGSLKRYVPVEVSLETAERAARRMADDYAGLDVHAVVGDFDHHLDEVPPGDGRMAIFLGGTIGNFMRADAVEFLRDIRRLLDDEGHLLLGTDLVKDPQRLHDAYNDSRGVTAAFNLNILNVVNNQLDADFDLDRFEHVAFYDEDEARIEMHLRAKEKQQVLVRELGLVVDFEEGERMRTEVSHKYTREAVVGMLQEAGLELDRWFTDDEALFGLSLSCPR